MDEEYPPEEYGPKWSDQRVERMLGALVCAVVGLLLALIVTVFVRAWPSFAHNGLAWFGSGGNVDDQLNTIYLSGLSGANYVYTFHAWQLIWSTFLIIGGGDPHGALLLALRRRLPRRVRPRVDEQHPRARGPLPGQRALGDLRPARRPGHRPLHRQPPGHRVPAGVGRRGDLAQRLQPAGGDPDPHGDDRAADDLDLLRRPALGPPGLARRVAGARRQPLAHDLEDRRADRAARDRRRHRARGRPGDRRGGDAGDGLRLGRLRPQPGRWR